MAYTANVPQSNQTIAQTQAPILANFQFIPNAVGQEHNWDASDATKTYHKQASMPNRATPGSLPAATNGMYYVTGGQAHFYDGTVDWLMNNWQGVASGTFTPTSHVTYDDVFTMPANVAGMILFYRTTPAVSKNFSMLGTFFTDATKCYAFSSLIKINSDSNTCAIELLNTNNASRAIRGRAGDITYAGIAYTYRIFYRPI